MATIASLLPRVRIHAMEAPDYLLNLFFVDAAREFCRRTRAWRKDLAAIDTDSGTSIYTVTPPAGTEVSDILMGEIDGKDKLLPKTSQQLAELYSDWRTVQGSPKYIRGEGTNQFRLIPTPQTMGYEDLLVTVALIPTLDATDIDDKVVLEHLDALIHGTLALVYDIPDKKWTNHSEAHTRRIRFENAIGPAAARADAEYTKGVTRTVRYGGL